MLLYRMSLEQRNQVANDLMFFLERIEKSDNVTPAEIIAFPDIAEWLLIHCAELHDPVGVALISYVHRVARNKNATSAEIAALSKVANLMKPSICSSDNHCR